MTILQTTQSQALPSEDLSLRQAKFLADSTLIPEKFRGRIGDVLVAIGIAKRLKISPFEVLNALVMIQGRATFSAQFIIALAHTRGPFKSRIQYKTEGQGEAISVSAFATMPDDSTAQATVTMETAKKEGWTRNPKYQSMPEHMLRYRAAIFLVRQYCPEILLGMQTKEEIEDVQIATSETKIESLNAKIANQ